MRAKGRHASYRAILLFSMVALLLQGCGVFPSRESEPINTFTLNPSFPPQIQAAEPGKGTLLVNRPDAQSGFNTPRMAYVSRKHELHYFAVNEWAGTPAEMFHPLLVKAFESTNQWEAVVQMPSPVRGEYQLVSDTLLLQQEFMQEPSRVRIHLRFQLIRLHDFHVVGTREFTVLENAKSDDPYGGVQAANAAAERLLQHVSDWLSLCIGKSTDNHC